MATLKVGTWNIEHFGGLVRKWKENNAGLTASELRRIEAIVHEIRTLNCDVLCVIEGPKPPYLADFCTAALNGEWQAIERAPGDKYFMGNGPKGPQNILFIAKPEIAAAARLVPISHWQAMTERSSRRMFSAAGEVFKRDLDPYVHTKQWKVGHPFFRDTPAQPARGPGDSSANGNPNLDAIVGAVVKPPVEAHKHHRHPQLLAFDLHNPANGERTRVELIGLHMKSKINMESWKGTLEKSPDHIREAVAARIKLTTEAMNVRYYLEERFDQNDDCAIFLMGDLNDGPGKDFWEEIFLFHDLVGNLQGDVYFAKRFLNHALFDFKEEHRWSAEFDDRYNPGTDPIRVLIDHILYTQRLVRPEMKKHLWVGPQAGQIEHELHGAVNASLPGAAHTSDHRPVTCVITLEDGLEFAASA